jgi:hypothetical protein
LPVRLRRSCLFGCAVLCALVVPHGPGAGAGVERQEAAKPLPKLSAVFTERSYVSGQLASLKLRSDARVLTLRILRAGAERAWGSVGKPWGPPLQVRWDVRGRSAALPVRIGDWPSGLYFARLATRKGDVTYAPFVVRPSAPGRVRVAVILPTNTWAAYNFWDADADGTGDTWYADQRRQSASLQRPFLNAGKPPYYRTNDRGFLRFLVHRGRLADYYSDEDFDLFESGEQLAGLYDLIVFAGHHEYQTTKSYDLAERYRDLGGNLAFLSANNFFWRVDLKDRKLWRIKKWRDLGRPEARLIGVQYRANDDGSRAAPYTVVNRNAAPWLFAGLETADGSPLGEARYGIEFDMVTPDSPAGTTVLAEVNPGLADPTIRGQMTYYETSAGARVFAAGTLSFGGSDNPVGERLFTNIWDRLTRP